MKLTDPEIFGIKQSYSRDNGTLSFHASSNYVYITLMTKFHIWGQLGYIVYGMNTKFKRLAQSF